MKTSLPSHAVSAALGRHVFSPSGAYVGDVIELLIDVDDGRIAQAVVVPGGPFGLESRWLCVPFTGLRFDDEHDCFVLRTEQHAARAPSADDNVRRMVLQSGLHRTLRSRSSPVCGTMTDLAVRRRIANS